MLARISIKLEAGGVFFYNIRQKMMQGVKWENSRVAILTFWANNRLGPLRILNFTVNTMFPKVLIVVGKSKF